MDEEKCKPHPSETLEFVTIPASGRFSLPGLYGGDDGRARTNTAPTVQQKGEAAHRNDTTSLDHMFAELSRTIPGYDDMVNKSEATRIAEQSMTFRQGLRLHWKGIAWSALLSLTLVMEGYDLAIINGFFAFPQFRRNYGKLTAHHEYQISTVWQSALTNGAVSGEIIGLFVNGKSWVRSLARHRKTESR